MRHPQTAKSVPFILIVDDEKPLRILLRRAMEKEGYEVLEANDGKECLEICFNRIPDIILLDAVMPVMDGFECCSQLQPILQRQPPAALTGFCHDPPVSFTSSTPVLMITGLDDPDSVDRAFAAGATDYITKPIHWAVLRQRVKRLLQANQVMEELQLQTAQARLMTSMLERIRQSLTLETILNTTVAEVQQFLRTDRVLIYRLDPDGWGQMVVESVAPGWKPVVGEMVADPCFVGKYTQLYQNGRIHACEDIYNSDLSPCHIELLAQFQVKANLVVPILQGTGLPNPDAQNKTVELPSLWGLLIAHHCETPRRWQASEIELVKRLATQVAIAIKQSQLYQQLQALNQELKNLASLDGLTQVANRRQFDEHLAREWRRMIRLHAPISLILCDVDFFKLYNDTYGHQAGDECLKQVAQTLHQTLKRSGDLVARYGGEEFAVILPETSKEGALFIAQEMHQRINQLQIRHCHSEISQCITLSFGVTSQMPAPGDSWEVLIKMADQALYQAKKEGRDRIVFQEESS